MPPWIQRNARSGELWDPIPVSPLGYRSDAEQAAWQGRNWLAPVEALGWVARIKGVEGVTTG